MSRTNKAKGSEKRTKMIWIRATPEEIETMTAKAKKAGLPLSSWLRAIALAASAAMMVGCGGTEYPVGSRADGMWTSSDGVLSCVGATPEAFRTDEDPSVERARCRWACSEIDGVTYHVVLLGFVRPTEAAEWLLESEQMDEGVCE